MYHTKKIRNVIKAAYIRFSSTYAYRHALCTVIMIYTCTCISSTVLLCLLIALLHKISVSDRYFDSHREACKFSFVFSLHSLKLLFKDNHAVNSTTSKYIKYLQTAYMYYIYLYVHGTKVIPAQRLYLYTCTCCTFTPQLYSSAFFLTEYILSELYLEFCEEADDSTDSSCEDGETQMAN